MRVRALVVLGCAGCALAQDAPRPTLDREVVAPAPFRVTVDVDGVFEQPGVIAVRHAPEAFLDPVVVLESRAPGPIERGDLIARFDATALEEALRQAELDVVAARLLVERRRADARRAEETARIQVRTAEREVEVQRTSLERKRAIEVPDRLQASEESVQSWDDRRAEREAMFAVLVAMYEADGVLETRERMDVEQQRRALARDAASRPRILARHELLRDVTLPHEVATLELAVRRTEHAAALQRALAALDVAAGAQELGASERELARLEERLATLRRERTALTLRAPVDGILVPATFDGTWSAHDRTERLLRPGARVAPGAVLGTIVRPAPERVRATLPEAFALAARPGCSAELRPTARPELALPAELTRVDRHVVDGRVAIELRARLRHERLLPGSTCRVRLVLRDEPAALTVPEAALDLSTGTPRLHVLVGSVATPRPVQLGLTHAGRTEILGGLAAGETVMLFRHLP